MSTIDYVERKFAETGEFIANATPIEGLLWDLLLEAKALRSAVEAVANDSGAGWLDSEVQNRLANLLGQPEPQPAAMPEPLPEGTWVADHAGTYQVSLCPNHAATVFYQLVAGDRVSPCGDCGAHPTVTEVPHD